MLRHHHLGFVHSTLTDDDCDCGEDCCEDCCDTGGGYQFHDKCCLLFDNWCCCCGSLSHSLKGVCLRHVCAWQISAFPLYHIFSVISSFTSVVNRIRNGRKQLIFYLLLNGFSTFLAMAIHFVFTYKYIDNNSNALDTYHYFYFIELEICSFLWCLALISSLRNYKDKYWILILIIYFYLGLIISVTMSLCNAQLSIYTAITIVSCFQLSLICIFFGFTEINQVSYYPRSAVLIVLIIFVLITGWNDVYKVWLFSILLIHYINLHSGDFTIPATKTPNQYQKLPSKRKDVFRSMIQSGKHQQYQKLTWFNKYSAADTQDDFEGSCYCEPELSNANGNIFAANLHYNGIKFDCLDLYLKNLYNNNELIISHNQPTDEKLANANSNYLTLSHEYESNQLYNFDIDLLRMIGEDANYYQSLASNKYFIKQEIVSLIIFVKFATFRSLYNKSVLEHESAHPFHFTHFHRILSDIACLSDFENSTKTGYTVLNSQISSRTPIIFSSNFKTMFDFGKLTNNKYQGIPFIVEVSGIFVPISCFGAAFDEIFICIPTNVQIANCESCDDLISITAAQQLRDLLKLNDIIFAKHMKFEMNQINSLNTRRHSMHNINDKAMDNIQRTMSTDNIHKMYIDHDRKEEKYEDEERKEPDNGNINFEELRIRLQQIQHCISSGLLKELFKLYKKLDAIKEWELELFCDVILNWKDADLLTHALFYIKTVDVRMRELCCSVWIHFFKNNVDHIAIIKLRKKCRDIAEDIAQIPRRTLLQYATNGILDKIADEIKTIPWKEYIEHYISCHIFQSFDEKQRFSVTGKQIATSLAQKAWKLADIIGEYGKIVNHINNDGQQREMKQFLNVIVKDRVLSQLLDISYDIQQDIIFKKSFMSNYQCQLKENCQVLTNHISTRNYRDRLLSKTARKKPNIYLQHMTIGEHSKMELLDLIHVRTLHKESHYRESVPMNQPLTDNPQQNKMTDALFMDTLSRSFISFCESEEYDSDAIYMDLFDHVIGDTTNINSNIYVFFQNNAFKTDEYYLLKYGINEYVNLIEFDFGEHVSEWNVLPKFGDTEQEWLRNDFFAIGESEFNTIRYQAVIIADQNRNTSKYNLSAHEILCIKMYTDTNELQNNFRKAFRKKTKSGDDRIDDRRQQFYHWATDLSLIFIKIEISNELYQFNSFFCDSTLYHGLDRLFNTKGLVNQFYGPLSTSWQSEVATNFAGRNGMILQIDHSVNGGNVNAIAVDWISCHRDEKEILLLNPIVMIQQSVVVSNDTRLKSLYLKNTLFATLEQDPNAFTHLRAFLQSPWIESCLEDVVDDEEFVRKRVKLFEVKKCLQNMSLFEFIFFICAHYQIAEYVNAKYKCQREIFEIIIGTDLFLENEDGWIQSKDRSQRICSKHQPTQCTVNASFHYDDGTVINKQFIKKQAKEILCDTNLLLQYIDQRKLSKSNAGLRLDIDMEIKYQHRFNKKEMSAVRIWQCKSSDLALDIGNIFKWKISKNTSLTRNTLYVSSLWLSNNCTVTMSEMDGENVSMFRIVCEETLRMEEGSSVYMNERNVVSGKKGGNDSTQNKQYGYKDGCGGGTILIICDEIIMNSGARMAAIGGDGINGGRGGNGGSILMITNAFNTENIDEKDLRKLFSVTAGKGDDNSNGVDGDIKFGYFNNKKNAVTLQDEFTPKKKKEIADCRNYCCCDYFIDEGRFSCIISWLCCFCCFLGHCRLRFWKCCCSNLDGYVGRKAMDVSYPQIDNVLDAVPAYSDTPFPQKIDNVLNAANSTVLLEVNTFLD